MPGNILADGEGTFFSEDFEGGLPLDWAVVSVYVPCDIDWCSYWTDSNPCNRTAYDGCSGIFMIADSRCCDPDEVMLTELRTPSIDCSGYDSVIRNFDHHFDYHEGEADERADVDISNDAGLTWTNILA